jgi:hypothetical protein
VSSFRFLIVVLVTGFASLWCHANESVLVVGSGGWMSCRQGIESQFIASQFTNLLTNLRIQFPDTQFDELLTCSSGLPAANGTRPVEYLYRSGGICRHGQVSSCRLADLVRELAPVGTKIFMIGHSHGGWHVMQAAAKLGAVDGLFTIEAISAAECDTRAYLRNRGRRLFTQLGRVEPGCRRAPTDVDTMSVFYATNGNWYNHHLSEGQDRGHLHSSAAQGAINFAYMTEGGDRAHHRLGLDHRVWTQICHAVSEILGGGIPGYCPAIIVDDQGKVISTKAP